MGQMESENNCQNALSITYHIDVWGWTVFGNEVNKVKKIIRNNTIYLIDHL